MDVRKIAKLAHLEITDEEVALYTPQMNDIVAYVEQLNELDTEQVEPAIGGLTPKAKRTKPAAKTFRTNRSVKKPRSTKHRRRSKVISKFRKFYEFQISNFKFQIFSISLSLFFFNNHCLYFRLQCSESGKVGMRRSQRNRERILFVSFRK